MESKEITERKKIISSKLGNLMKRIVLHELSNKAKDYNFTLQVSSHGNHFRFEVCKELSRIEQIEYFCLRWAIDPNITYFNEIAGLIDKSELLFIKYSNLNKQ